MDLLVSVLNDRYGVLHFRQFLSTKHASDILEFWLACVGFRKVDPARRSSFALVIYKTFIVSAASRVRLTGNTRRTIKERLKCGNVDHTVFDSAVAEVETLLLRDYYPQFLESDDYAEYIQARSANKSPSSDGSSGNSGNCTSQAVDGARDRLCNEETKFCNLDGFSACTMLKDPKTRGFTSAGIQCTGDCLAQTRYVDAFCFVLFNACGALWGCEAYSRCHQRQPITFVSF